MNEVTTTHIRSRTRKAKLRQWRKKGRREGLCFRVAVPMINAYDFAVMLQAHVFRSIHFCRGEELCQAYILRSIPFWLDEEDDLLCAFVAWELTFFQRHTLDRFWQDECVALFFCSLVPSSEEIDGICLEDGTAKIRRGQVLWLRC